MAATLESEVIDSKRIIEKQLRQKAQGFCYPNGNHDAMVEVVVRTAGYNYACITRTSYVEPYDNPYQLNRILVHEGITFSIAMFACHIAGIFNHGRHYNLPN